MAEEMKAMVAERDDARAYASKLKSLHGKLVAENYKLTRERQGSAVQALEQKIIAACRSRKVRPPKDTASPHAWVGMALRMRDENAHSAYTVRKVLVILDEAGSLKDATTPEGSLVASVRSLIDDTNAQQQAVIDAGKRAGLVEHGDDPADVATAMADWIIELKGSLKAVGYTMRSDGPSSTVTVSGTPETLSSLGLKPSED